jgi:hypothetical protein
MPWRSGVAAPITPDNLTTGTTGASPRRRGGNSRLSPRSVAPKPLSRISIVGSLALIGLKSARQEFSNHSAPIWNDSSTAAFFDAAAQDEGGKAMKIYLLMLLIAALLTAVHVTAPASTRRREAAPR